MQHSRRRTTRNALAQPDNTLPLDKASALIPALEQKIARARQSAQDREATEVLQLPLWPPTRRGTPNTFIRSALFSAIQSKDRAYLKEEVLASQDGITVKFTGQQLNQEDLSLWETLVHMAKELPLGSILQCSAHSILTALGLPHGGEQHKQLHSGIIRLTACAVEVVVEGKKFFGPLIKGGVQAEVTSTSHYALELNRGLIKLYGECQWTAIDWEQRRRLARKPLAQALHGYYSSHRNPYPVTLKFLQRITGSRNKQVAGFKRRCGEALKELIDVGFLLSYEFQREERMDKETVEKVAVLRAHAG
jgi:TrfA protein